MRNFISALIMGTFLVLGCAGAYAQGTGPALAEEIRPAGGRPLSEALDPSGRIRPGISRGSFDVRGYRMQLSKDGSPSFTSSPQDSNWDSRFWLPGADNYVYATALDSAGNLYVGGGFTAINGDTSLRYLAKWNGSSWSALGSGINDFVLSIAISGSDMYVGGEFTTAGGLSANRIAKWNGSSWSALGSGVDDFVMSIGVSGNDVYVGGLFTTAGGDSTKYVAKWNGSSWSALGNGVTGGTYPGVYAISVSGSDVYVGGEFDTAGGVSANSIAKWNGSSWSALGSGVDGFIYDIAVSGSDVYAGGFFYTAGVDSANSIAKWNGSSWSALGNGVDDDEFVMSIAVNGSDVYVGGWFTTAGGVSANGIAKWNGSSWSALGSGVGGTYPGGVRAIAVNGGDVYAGGFFNTAGGKPSSRFGIYHDVPTGVAGKPELPITNYEFKLGQNRPNPFGTITTIKYQLPKAGQVSLKVYNIAGQLVKILDDGYRTAGEHSITWDGKDENGKRVAGGLYFYRLSADGVSVVKKLVLVK